MCLGTIFKFYLVARPIEIAAQDSPTSLPLETIMTGVKYTRIVNMASHDTIVSIGLFPLMFKILIILL